MNVACDYEAPMQMLTTEKYIAAWLYRSIIFYYIYYQQLFLFF